MGWSERLRQMVLAGGVLLSGCGGRGGLTTADGAVGAKAGAGATGSAGRAGGAAGTSSAGEGGAGGAGVTTPVPEQHPILNAVPDPYAICKAQCGPGRDAASAVCITCDAQARCEDAGATFTPYGHCEIDGGLYLPPAVDTDGGVDHRDATNPSDVGFVSQPLAPAACERPDGQHLGLTTLDELEQAIRGTWQLCSPMGLFRQPQAGVYIDTNNRFVLLELVNGKLVPKTGPDATGHLEFIWPANGDGAWFQMSFVSDRGGTIYAAPPVFSDDPRVVTINNNGVDTYRYIAVRP